MGEGAEGVPGAPPAGSKWLLGPETRPVWGQAGIAGRGPQKDMEAERQMETGMPCGPLPHNSVLAAWGPF